MTSHSFLEIGAAALLVGDIESKMKGQPWKFFGTDDMPYLDQLLQSSPVTPITDSDSARPHLRAITASKRIKPGSRQIWHVLIRTCTDIFLSLLYEFMTCQIFHNLLFLAKYYIRKFELLPS